jgi:hypothetical protein
MTAISTGCWEDNIMALGEDLLSSWAAAPGDAKAQEAYKQVQEALNSHPVLASKSKDVYLQGSYRNRTHIRADSDVDVVAELQSTFYYDIDSLSIAEKSLFHATFLSPATYSFDNFKQDVGRALIAYFGENSVTEGNKCFNIRGNAKRSNVDVLACLEHRKYVQFSTNQQPYLPGVKFYTKNERNLVINWPKLHYKNGAAKNQMTNEMFKGLARIAKHIRRLLIEHKLITAELAPSYFLECLLYNIPNTCFAATYTASLNEGIRYLQNTPLTSFKCVNQQDFLFLSNNAWSEQSARAFIQFIALLNQ